MSIRKKGNISKCSRGENLGWNEETVRRWEICLIPRSANY